MKRNSAVCLHLVCTACLVFSLNTASLARDKVVVVPLNTRGGDYQTVTSAGQVWMDRNLGAIRVAGSKSDSLAYGWLYQWGRLADGHENPESPEVGTRSSGNEPGHGNFINGFTDWRLTPNNNLWQGVDGTNNPCPSGFRIPTETEWETERASWSSNNSTGAFSSPLKLVNAGFRVYTDGAISIGGTHGYYWSSTANSSSARSHHFNSGDAGMYTNPRAYGFSVRCIRD